MIRPLRYFLFIYFSIILLIAQLVKLLCNELIHLSEFAILGSVSIFSNLIHKPYFFVLLLCGCHACLGRSLIALIVIFMISECQGFIHCSCLLIFGFFQSEHIEICIITDMLYLVNIENINGKLLSQGFAVPCLIKDYKKMFLSKKDHMVIGLRNSLPDGFI